MRDYTCDFVTCLDCGRDENPFILSKVEDAWVKEGIAHFQFTCDCGAPQILELPWGNK